MLKIRKNVFETNSSSTHTLTVRKKELKELTTEEIKGFLDIAKDENNCIKIILDKEYDQDWDLLETPLEKLKYIITKEMYKSPSLDYYMSTEEYYKLNEWVKELGYNELLIDEDKQEYYVGHQSVYDIFDVDIIEIITNPNYVIVIGSDNSYAPDFIKRIVEYEE